jgi:hypothetical protein
MSVDIKAEHFKIHLVILFAFSDPKMEDSAKVITPNSTFTELMSAL